MADLVTRSTERDATARAGRIRQGIHNYLHTLADIAAAYRQGDHFTLGYESWDAYLDGEYGAVRLKLPIEQRKKAISELRLEGMSTRAIGSTLGEPRETVRRDLAGDPDGSPAAPVLGRDQKTYSPPRPPPVVAASVEPQRDAGQPGPWVDPRPAVTPEEAAARVNAVLDVLVPDPDKPAREFQLHYLGLLLAGRKILRVALDEVIEYADDECLNQLAGLATDLGHCHDQVVKARLAKYGDNVMPLKRNAQ